MPDLILPTEKTPVELKSPAKFLMYSEPKAGKTTLLSLLEDCLIIDLEDGARHIEALKVKVGSYKQLIQLIVELQKKKKELGHVPYKYIAIDSTTVLEDLSLVRALQLYKATPMGANFDGTDVRTLPNGAGWLYARQAFLELTDALYKVTDRLILVAHLQDKMIEKGGKETPSKDIQLTGKLKSIICSQMDAIAYIQRDDKKVYANFNSSDERVCGARPIHLRGKSILLGESKEDGSVKAFWNNIFID